MYLPEYGIRVPQSMNSITYEMATVCLRVHTRSARVSTRVGHGTRVPYGIYSSKRTGTAVTFRRRLKSYQVGMAWDQ